MGAIMAEMLIVNEIFLSLQGEGTRAGRPCVLVRLTGCDVGCRWCDTRHARDEGEEMTIDAIDPGPRIIGNVSG